MRTRRFQLLTVLLAVVMMFALSIQAYAATSKPVTQDGITATLVTDKDSYTAGESVNATVKIENNTGKDVFIFTQITVPSAVKLAGASAFDAILADGQSWTSAAGIVADGTAGSTATGDNMQAGLWSVVSILAIAGVVALLVYGKNRKNWVSIMLLVVMIGGMMAAAVPAQAAGVSRSMDLNCAVQVDGKATAVTAVVNYIIGYEAGSAATTTPSETPDATPTETPTAAPTETPTEAPTEAPTETPTETPTEAPTEAPTETPTEAPTEAPTATPTETPTEAPAEEAVLKGWYFETAGDKEGFSQGGSTGIAVKDGAFVVTAAADGQPRVWSTYKVSGEMVQPLNLPAEYATHLRMLVKSAVSGQTMVVFAELTDAEGTVTTATYKVPLHVSEDEYSEITIDLQDSAAWDNSLTLQRFGIYPFGNANTQYANAVIYFDAIEVININGETPEDMERPGIEITPGDDGTGEVAGDEYKVLFGSYYFKNTIENWIVGGYTQLEQVDGALQVTAAADGQPRFWSTSEVKNPNDSSVSASTYPLEISTADLDYIRIRVKSGVEEIKKMVVVAEYRDKDYTQKTSKNYTIPADQLDKVVPGDTYSEILIDVSDIGDGYTLDRLGIYPYGQTNNTELANDVLYIGSIEFLQELTGEETEPLKVLIIGNSITQHAPSASYGWYANWGMAATGPEKDYVHLLQAKALAANPNVEMHWVNISEYEKYFYDWSKITRDFSKYAEFDADIIITNFGSNVKYGGNEGDSSYENDYTFDKEQFKAIVDYFNPGSDAEIIACGTRSNATITPIIIEAAETYGWDYIDMSGLTTYENIATPYETVLKDKFKVDSINAGVLNHPGDAGMAEIADRIWAVLSPLLTEE